MSDSQSAQALDLSPLTAAREIQPGPVLRTFFNIARAWKLDRPNTMALLGIDATTTYSAWKKHPDTARLRPDTYERLSYVLGIYKALHILLPDASAADSWIHKPNAAPLFGGNPALTRMTSSRVADLAKVREYLDAQRGW